jgi:uncharacterized protein DUF6923
MRRTLLRSFSALSLLALVAGGSSGALAAASPPSAPPAAADPCHAVSALAEPAACAAAQDRPASGDGTDVAVAPGNAFVDGLSIAGGGDPDKLTFPASNMSTTQQVADENTGPSIFGYDFSPDTSVLYGVDNTASALVTIDQATGASTTVGPMTKTVSDTWVDLSIDPATGQAYAAASGVTDYTLFTVNLATGATTPVATVPFTQTLIDMSINCSGAMYATTVGDDQLYSVNRTTGALTVVGPLGVNLSFAQGIDFDNVTGTLNGWLYSGGGAHQYSTINLTTGAAAQLGPSDPNGEFEGAIKNQCAAPAVAITSGPTGHTADPRPTFGFTAGNATTVQCSIDKGTPAYTACGPTSFQPAAGLAPGAWTFRVLGSHGVLTGQATRAFTVVDCAPLKAAVAKGKKAVKKAKKALKAAKKSGSATKIKKAGKKLKKAKKKLKKAKAALAAEPVCS